MFTAVPLRQKRDDTEKLEDLHLINQTVLASSEHSQLATGSVSFSHWQA